MSQMHNPPHPGETLREDVLPALGLTVTESARQLGVTRAALSRILNGHAAISPEMALRLEEWLGVDQGGRAELWLGQQMAYDIWQARHNPRRTTSRCVRPYKTMGHAEKAPVQGSGIPWGGPGKDGDKGGGDGGGARGGDGRVKCHR